MAQYICIFMYICHLFYYPFHYFPYIVHFVYRRRRRRLIRLMLVKQTLPDPLLMLSCLSNKTSAIYPREWFLHSFLLDGGSARVIDGWLDEEMTKIVIGTVVWLSWATIVALWRRSVTVLPITDAWCLFSPFRSKNRFTGYFSLFIKLLKAYNSYNWFRLII